jgi:sugar phosphate isomerase/epimerase
MDQRIAAILTIGIFPFRVRSRITAGMKIGICSFSFHRLLAAGKQDIFQYIKDCKDLGCTQLDPWVAHLSPPHDGSTVIQGGRNPSQSHQTFFATPDDAFVRRIVAAAGSAGLPFGTIAVDGAHIYEPDDATRQANRERAYRWLDVARQLGATQVRIDAGGPEEMPPDAFRIIVDGYRDLIARARPMGIEILTENHWGPTRLPDNVLRLLEACPGLGFLYDTRNWKPELIAEGRRKLAPFATATHVKCPRAGGNGDDPNEDVAGAVKLLLDAGYDGAWGIESVPLDGDEIAGARRTIELLRRLAD